MDLLEILDRPIAFHRSFVAITGSVEGALFLSQLVYWQNRSEDGWIYKTADEWYEETGLTRRQLERVRRELVEIGILIEELRGLPAVLHYRIDEDRLASLISRTEGIANITGRAKREGGVPPCKLVSTKRANLIAQNVQTAEVLPGSYTYLESSTETTTETTFKGDENDAKNAKERKRKTRTKQLTREKTKTDTAHTAIFRAVEDIVSQSSGGLITPDEDVTDKAVLIRSVVSSINTLKSLADARGHSWEDALFLAIREIVNNNFLMGQNPSSFRATFGWCFRKSGGREPPVVRYYRQAVKNGRQIDTDEKWENAINQIQKEGLM